MTLTHLAVHQPTMTANLSRRCITLSNSLGRTRLLQRSGAGRQSIHASTGLTMLKIRIRLNFRMSSTPGMHIYIPGRSNAILNSKRGDHTGYSGPHPGAFRIVKRRALDDACIAFSQDFNLKFRTRIGVIRADICHCHGPVDMMCVAA